MTRLRWGQRLRLVRVNRLFVKLLLYFLSLLLPIILIGTWTFFHFVNQSKQDFTDKMTMSLQSSAASIDNDLRVVQELAVGMFQDPTIIRLLKPYASYTLDERAQLIQIWSRLRHMQSIVNDVVDDMFLYIDSSKVFTSEGLVDFPSFFETHYRLESYDASFWQRKRDDAVGVEVLNRTSVDAIRAKKDVIPLVVPGMVQGVKAVLVMPVSAAVLTKTLEGGGGSASTRYIVTNQERVLLASDRSFSNASVHAQLAAARASHGAFQGTMTIEQEPYLVTSVQSGLYGWQYYALTPVWAFHEQAAGIINMIVLICTVLIVISVGFAFIFTYRIYNPIRRLSTILDEHEQRQRDNDGKEDEFHRIGAGIYQLLGETEQAQEQFDLISAQYLDYVLLQMIQGHAYPKDDMQRMLRNAMRHSCGKYVCSTIGFDFDEAFFTAFQDVDRIRIQGKLKNLIYGMLHRDAHLYVLECEHHQYICIWAIEAEEGLKPIRDALDAFAAMFRYDSVFCRVGIGLGEVYDGIEGIALSYRDAMRHLQQQTSCDDFMLQPGQHYEETEKRSGTMYLFSDESKLINLLKAGDAEHLVASVEQLLEAQEQKGAPADQLHLLVSDVHYTALRLLAERGMDEAAIGAEEEMRLLASANAGTYEARKEALLRVYRTLAEHMQKQQQAYRSGALVSRMMQYIDDYYEQDLYLEKIADEVRVSVKYVSRLFKDKTGMTITDYICQVRIAKAKELLIHTNGTVQEIAEQVGIPNRTTFLRTFKKVEGLSPNEFRKTYAMEPQADS